MKQTNKAQAIHQEMKQAGINTDYFDTTNMKKPDPSFKNRLKNDVHQWIQDDALHAKKSRSLSGFVYRFRSVGVAIMACFVLVVGVIQWPRIHNTTHSPSTPTTLITSSSETTNQTQASNDTEQTRRTYRTQSKVAQQLAQRQTKVAQTTTNSSQSSNQIPTATRPVLLSHINNFSQPQNNATTQNNRFQKQAGSHLWQ